MKRQVIPNDLNKSHRAEPNCNKKQIKMEKKIININKVSSSWIINNIKLKSTQFGVYDILVSDSKVTQSKKKLSKK
jgi:hypothetical protein